MLYFILMPLNLLCALFCYITNPIVCLFADEVGDLPGFLQMWQTWDDSLDVDFYVKEKAPSIFRYDFDAKYISSRKTTPELVAVGRDRGCVILRPGATFSTKEKIQRYFCRVGWLMRNDAYGFSFFLFGRNVKGSDIRLVKNVVDPMDGTKEMVIGYDSSTNWFNRTWIVYINRPIFWKFTWNIFLGWKLDYSDPSPKYKKAMIANRISIRISD